MGFNGTVTFMYRVQNAAGATDATVTIQVGNPPDAVDAACMTTVNVPLVVPAPGLLAKMRAMHGHCARR